MSADLSPEAYDDLLDRLADGATEQAEGEPDTDAIWAAVGQVVPELTDPVSERILDLADSEPDARLVDVVTEERHSDDEEHRRAEAVTVLVQDVEARLVEEGG